MATIVTVHGTFAHTGGTADALALDASGERQWWQPGSGFEACLRDCVKPDDGRLDYVPFVWDAANSELSRRQAGSRLLALMRGLDKKGESYCVVGHSHGGSVISSALLESVAYGRPLTGLKKWITVGTPFVALRKELFLFTRLNLFQKMLFVASLMLLMMFAFYAVGEFFSGGGGRRMRGDYFATGLLFSGAMMSLPFIVFYIVLKFRDGRELFLHRPRTIRRAREAYGDRWLSLCHQGDEAVQGLKVLPDVKLQLFDREFAAPALTMGAIFVLPLLYLFVLTSPPLMVGIADFLKNSVYAADRNPALESALNASRESNSQLWRKMRQAREQGEGGGFDPARGEAAREEVQVLRRQMRETRKKLQETYPELANFERAQRFRRRFLEVNGKPCEGNTLCGGGNDYFLNSKLLYHVVTDELSSAVVGDEFGGGVLGGAFVGALRLLVPIILVPLVFAVLAMVLLGIIQFVARHVSSAASWLLNRLTLSEIKRSAFGNDTEGEIALGADQRPFWLDKPCLRLPTELGDKIAAYSDQMTMKSLAKFRNAISALAFSEGDTDKAGLVSTYLTWRELIHTGYFEVPEFCKVVSYAISHTEGFQPNDPFRSEPTFEHAGLWLAAVHPAAPAQVA